jgi:hypothetical protein
MFTDESMRLSPNLVVAFVLTFAERRHDVIWVCRLCGDPLVYDLDLVSGRSPNYLQDARAPNTSGGVVSGLLSCKYPTLQLSRFETVSNP